MNQLFALVFLSVSLPTPVFETPPAIIIQAEVSAYTASASETDNSPCITADNTNICIKHPNIVANNCLNFGTRVEINGVIYEVHDRMNRRYGKDYFDILMDTRAEALQFGRRKIEVKIYDNSR